MVSGSLGHLVQDLDDLDDWIISKNMWLEIYNEVLSCLFVKLQDAKLEPTRRSANSTQNTIQHSLVWIHTTVLFIKIPKLGWGWTLFWFHIRRLGNLTHSLMCSCCDLQLCSSIFENIYKYFWLKIIFFTFSSPYTFFNKLSKLVQYLLIHCVPILFQLCRQQDIDRCHETAVVVFKGGVPNPSNSRRF